MLLCVDVGNTQIALGLYEDTAPDDPHPALVRDWRMRTDRHITADELEVAFGGLLGGYSDQVTGIAALSTVPSLMRELKLLIDRRGDPAVIVGPGVRTGVPLLVDNPREVGADRIVNAVAAYDLYGGPLIVIDFGTATTYDAVSARGELLGCAIAPGIDISLDALYRRADALRRVELIEPRNVVGRNTVESIQSGAIYGFAGQIDGVCARMADELGDVQVVATGGLATLIAPYTSCIHHLEPWLTLHGLRLIFAKNNV